MSRSYIGRHWRGELSLPISYLVNGILVTFAVTSIVLAISAMVGRYAPWPGFIAITGTWSFALLLTLWQIVGIWRSADNHPGRGGRIFWARVAKFMMVVGMLQTAVAFIQNGWPQIKESFLIVAGDQSIGTFTLRLMNGGTEIEFAGGIPFGAAEELTRVLNAAPQVRTIHFDSHGGRIGEAETLRDLIWERGLSTYVAGECLSACTVAYLGGHERYLHRNGRLGFHASSFPGLSASDMGAENRRIANEAVLFGVERHFAEKAYLSPAEDMWYPTSQELINAHFVTRIASGQFAISGFGRNPSTTFIASTLKEIPLYSTIAALEPKVFERMTEIFLDGAVEGQSEVQVSMRLRSIVADLLDKYAPYASNEALLDLGAVLVEELNAIGASDKLACYAFLFPQQGQSVNVSDYVSPELLARELNAAELAIITGASGGRYDLRPERIDALYAKVFAIIEQYYGRSVVEELVLMGTDLSALPRSRVCDITYALYSEILTLPPEEASDLLRHMFSQPGT